jgi:hypothetical protein
LQQQGRKSYVIPLGGTNPAGCRACLRIAKISSPEARPFSKIVLAGYKNHKVEIEI